MKSRVGVKPEPLQHQAVGFVKSSFSCVEANIQNIRIIIFILSDEFQEHTYTGNWT